MAILQPGKAYVPSGAAELRDNFLRDIRLEAISQGVTDPPVQPGTHWYNLATALGNAHLLHYANIAIADDDLDVLTATGQALDDKRAALGLPEVVPSPSVGTIVIGMSGGGAVTIPDGTQFVLPNGLRGKVTPAQLGVVDGAELPIVTIDTGSATKLAAGQKVRFVAPPLNVATEATVGIGFAGGLDEETDERKRDRILLAMQSRPAGGNWSHKIEVALEALASMQYAFVYPALGGPASELIVLVKDHDEDNSVYNRTVTTSEEAIVRAALTAEFGIGEETVVRSVEDQPVNVAIAVTIPDASTAGGDGTGWKNDAPWPPLEGGDTKVTITSYTVGSVTVVVNATTATAPVAGLTRILWWSPNDAAFHERLVTAQSGGTGAWTLTLDAPLVDSIGVSAGAGAYISPAMENSEGFGLAWRKIMRGMGPGEATADGNRLPRANRHPKPGAKWPMKLTVLQLDALIAERPEITDAAWSYRSGTPAGEPTVPGAVSTPPNVLVIGEFGIYPI